MKCKNCGAEAKGKFCEYCGSEMPQETTTVNITNNYYGDSSQGQGEIYVNIGTCPRCGGSSVKFKRERVGTVSQSDSRKNYSGTRGTRQSVSQAVYRTVGVCQSCGHTWNPDAVNKKASNKKNMALGAWLDFYVPCSVDYINIEK